jgi:hypothetical protein
VEKLIEPRGGAAIVLLPTLLARITTTFFAARRNQNFGLVAVDSETPDGCLHLVSLCRWVIEGYRRGKHNG